MVTTASGTVSAKRKPTLWGKLILDPCTLVITGVWGLFAANRLPKTKEELGKAPSAFELRLKDPLHHSDPIQSPADLFYDCGQARKEIKLTFEGSFTTTTTSDKGQKQEIKHNEEEVVLTFKHSGTKDSSCFEVCGSGKNYFGTYLVQGKYDTQENKVIMVRNYIPRNQRKRSRRVSRRKPVKKIKISPTINLTFDEILQTCSSLENILGVADIDPLQHDPAADLSQTNFFLPYSAGLSDPFGRISDSDEEDAKDKLKYKLKLGEVSYEELKNFDAKIIKELNEVGDFTCPSKR